MQLLSYCWATEIIELCNGNIIQQGQRGRLLILLSGRNYNFKFWYSWFSRRKMELHNKKNCWNLNNIHLFYFHGKSCAAIEILKYWIIGNVWEIYWMLFVMCFKTDYRVQVKQYQINKEHIKIGAFMFIYCHWEADLLHLD